MIRLPDFSWWGPVWLRFTGHWNFGLKLQELVFWQNHHIIFTFCVVCVWGKGVSTSITQIDIKLYQTKSFWKSAIQLVGRWKWWFNLLTFFLWKKLQADSRTCWRNITSFCRLRSKVRERDRNPILLEIENLEEFFGQRDGITVSAIRRREEYDTVIGLLFLLIMSLPAVQTVENSKNYFTFCFKAREKFTLNLSVNVKRDKLLQSWREKPYTSFARI